MSDKFSEAIELGRKDRAERDARVEAAKEAQRRKRDEQSRLVADIKLRLEPLFRSAHDALIPLGRCSIVEHEDHLSLEFEGDSFAYAKPTSNQLQVSYEVNGQKNGAYVAIEDMEEAIAKWMRSSVATLNE
jgi:hypothetical protein